MTKLEEELLRFRLSKQKKEECDQLPQASATPSTSTSTPSSSSLPVFKDKTKCLDESEPINKPTINEPKEIVPSSSSSSTTTATNTNVVATINSNSNTNRNTDNLVSDFARDFYASGYNYGHYNNYDFDYGQYDFDNIDGDDGYGWGDDDYVEEEDDDDEFIWTRKDVFTMICKISFYLVLQTIAFIHEFGAVFFTISLLIFICTNLSDRPRMEGEPSAYSVFNDNFEPIEGTVDAATLQNQLFFGSLWF